VAIQLDAPSQPVVGQDPGTWSALSGRATVSAVGHFATPRMASPARAASRESQTCHHGQTTADPLAKAELLGFGGGADSDSASSPAPSASCGPTADLGWRLAAGGEYHFVQGQVRRRKKQAFLCSLNKDYNHDLKGCLKARLPGPGPV